MGDNLMDDPLNTLPEVLQMAFTIACVLVGFSFFFILFRVAHKPRQILPSEKLYETVDSQGKIITDLALPSLEDDAEVFLSVVIPAYNEVERMPAMLAETILVLNEQFNKQGWEVLIVDDGSKDRTTSEALMFMKQALLEGKISEGQLRVCTLEINRGKGGAVTHGMQHHRGHYAIFADADGASRFSDVSLLLEAVGQIEKAGLAVAGGSRAHMVSTDAVVKRSPLRNLLMHGFHTFIRLLGVSHIKDTQCGFKLFSRAACKKIFPAMHIERYAFDVEIFLIAEMMGIPVSEVPITWHEVDGSKMNLVKDSLNMAWDLVLMRVGYTLGLWTLEM